MSVCQAVHLAVFCGILKVKYCPTPLDNHRPIKSNAKCQVLLGQQFEIICSHWLLTFEEQNTQTLNGQF